MGTKGGVSSPQNYFQNCFQTRFAAQVVKAEASTAFGNAANNRAAEINERNFMWSVYLFGGICAGFVLFTIWKDDVDRPKVWASAALFGLVLTTMFLKPLNHSGYTGRPHELKKGIVYTCEPAFETNPGGDYQFVLLKGSDDTIRLYALFELTTKPEIGKQYVVDSSGRDKLVEYHP